MLKEHFSIQHTVYRYLLPNADNWSGLLNVLCYILHPGILPSVEHCGAVIQ